MTRGSLARVSRAVRSLERVSTKYVTAAVAAQKGIEERGTSHIRQEILDAWPSSGEPITLEPEPLKGQQPDDGSESDQEM